MGFKTKKNKKECSIRNAPKIHLVLKSNWTHRFVVCADDILPLLWPLPYQNYLMILIYWEVTRML
jgi:hypothetical protein